MKTPIEDRPPVLHVTHTRDIAVQPGGRSGSPIGSRRAAGMIPFVRGILTVILASFGLMLDAQQDTARATIAEKGRKNSVYLEFLGNGVIYSLNYDRAFPLNAKLALFGRLGAGEFTGEGAKEDGHTNVNIILSAGLLYGPGKHLFETGLAYTIATYYPDNLIAITAGYRYCGRRGFLFRLTPMYVFNTETGDSFGNTPWIGLSMGYAF